jgi:parallel beta-helix repeat protein
VRAAWTGGPKETNGAYGIYPVESTGVLIDGCQVEGASDAGIYVGQSKDITVRYSLAQGNVAGVEIENSRNALVAYNLVTRNTGGILVFDLPNLPVMGGGNTVLTGNLVVGNDTPNFAPKGNIVAAVRRGTGVMVMANDGVRVTKNVIRDNPTSGIMVVSYPRPFTDKNYNPTPRNVMVDANAFAGNGLDPQLPGAIELKAAFGGAVPPVIWDGIGPAGTLMVDSSAPGLSLNLPGQGAGPEAARPALFTAATQVKRVDEKSVGAPAALDARIAG